MPKTLKSMVLLGTIAAVVLYAAWGRKDAGLPRHSGSVPSAAQPPAGVLKPAVQQHAAAPLSPRPVAITEAPSRSSQFSPAPSRPPAAPPSPGMVAHRAVARFQFENQPDVDGCLGADGAVHRQPTPVRILFRRESSGRPLSVARVEALKVTPVGDLSLEAKRCLERLRHRTLPFSETLAPGRLELEQIVTLVLPAPERPRATQ